MHFRTNKLLFFTNQINVFRRLIELMSVINLIKNETKNESNAVIRIIVIVALIFEKLKRNCTGFI